MKAKCIKDFYNIKSKYKTIFTNNNIYNFEIENNLYKSNNIKMDQKTFNKHFQIK